MVPRPISSRYFSHSCTSCFSFITSGNCPKCLFFLTSIVLVVLIRGQSYEQGVSFRVTGLNYLLFLLDISTTAPDEEHDNGRYNDNGATIQYAAVHLLVPFCGRNTLWYTLCPLCCACCCRRLPAAFFIAACTRAAPAAPNMIW